MADSFIKLDDWTLRSKRMGRNDKPTHIDGPEHEPLPAPGGGLVHEALIREGIIEDPLIGENCFSCEWIEQREWIYETTFDLPQSVEEYTQTELLFESLDGVADVLLNGTLIALHRNSYRPLSIDVSGRLKPRNNHLEIRLNLGLNAYTVEESVEPDGVSFATEESLGYRDGRGEPRRIFLRKPAYGFGWDWSPRVATIGIAGDVRLRASKQARIESLSCATLEVATDGSSAQVKVSVEFSGLHHYSSSNAVLSVKLVSPSGATVSLQKQPILVSSGFNEVEFGFTVQTPELWWPRGYGDQPLYTVHAQLEDTRQTTLSSMSRQVGIRSLRLLNTGTFAIEVNGRKIFCQGGNWVPPDAIYTRAGKDRYRSIIKSAAAANMNMLRIWGGGRYEPDFFYETCDRLGMLVWHDFMFACAPYPDHLDWFRLEVEQEARYQVRRLSGHACLALWCGSNENSWGMCDWWNDKTRRGTLLYNNILPRAVHEVAPHMAYWVGSPYGGSTPNETGTGNNHFWKEPGGTLCPDPAQRTDLFGHDRYRSFFISEYGYHGPCSRKETLRYLGTDEIDRHSRAWIHHTNTRSYENTLQRAVEQVYGIQLADASNDDYLLYGGLWQGIAYAYSLDSAHFRSECSGALIWMLNEAWGEAGWGIIDNNLNRKISWHFIRRALAPERLILRVDQDVVKLMLYSQEKLGQAYEVELRLNEPGEGSRTLARQVGITSSQRQIVIQIPRNDTSPEGTFVSAHGRIGHKPLSSILLWSGSYTSILGGDNPCPLKVQLDESPGTDDFPGLSLQSNRLIHAVHLTLDGEDIAVDDQYFDLFAGEQRTLRLNLPAAEVARINIAWIDENCKIQRHCLKDLAPLAIACP